MKINIKSLTPATLTLNCLGNYIIRGREVAPNIEIAEGQLAEVQVLERAGLIHIDYLDINSDIYIEQPKKSRGRPKGAKNKSTLENEKRMAAEAKEKVKQDAHKKLKKKADTETDKVTRNKTDAEAVTDKMGSDVVVCVPGGIAKGKMINSVIGEAKESMKAEESIQAMEDLEAEERAELARENGDDPDEDSVKDKWVVKEEDLDIADRMGEKAVISTGGESVKVDMVNSILPSADLIKERDPFIDKTTIESLTDNSDDNDVDDDFLEL